MQATAQVRSVPVLGRTLTRAVAGDWRDFEDRLGALLRMSGGAVAPDCDTEIACGALLLPRAAAVSTRLRVRCVEDRSHLRVPRVDEGVDAVSYVGADDMREVAGGEQAHKTSTSKAPPRGSWMTRLVSVPDRLARRHTNSAQTSVEEQSVACEGWRIMHVAELDVSGSRRCLQQNEAETRMKIYLQRCCRKQTVAELGR